MRIMPTTTINKNNRTQHKQIFGAYYTDAAKALIRPMGHAELAELNIDEISSKFGEEPLINMIKHKYHYTVSATASSTPYNHFIDHIYNPTYEKIIAASIKVAKDLVAHLDTGLF